MGHGELIFGRRADIRMRASDQASLEAKMTCETGLRSTSALSSLLSSTLTSWRVRRMAARPLAYRLSQTRWYPSVTHLPLHSVPRLRTRSGKRRRIQLSST